MSVNGNRAHETAEFMRQMARRDFEFSASNIAAAIGADQCHDSECWERLAELVDRPVVRGGAE